MNTVTGISRRQFMEGTAMGIAATGLGLSSLDAQDWARQAVDKSPRKHETVKVAYNDRSLDTFIAYPDSKDKSPSIIVIHDVIAFAPWVENVADRLAEAGYLAARSRPAVGPDCRRTPAAAIRRENRGPGPQAAPSPGRGGYECAGRPCPETPRLQRKGLRGGLLVGRRPGVPLRDDPQGPVGGLRVLWRLPRTGEHPQHPGARLWFLRRNGYAHRRHACGDPRQDESGGQILRAGHL